MVKRLINYSMCWEDPNLVLSALDVSSKDTVLSIASGGENLFAILLRNPKKLIAIDSNKYQIYLVKLKIAAIKEFDFEQFVGFIGFKKCKDRLRLFNRCKKHLSDEEIEFWNKNIVYINEGLINCGKFESYLGLFRKFILRLVLSKKKINNYLSLQNIEEQEKFYLKYWDNLKWRLLFRVFFSRTIMQLFGRDKRYFEQNRIKNIASHFYHKAKKGITRTPVKDNFFMHMILTGTIPTPFQAHPYLDKDNFLELKKKVDKITFFSDNLMSFLISYSGKIDKYSLSDIFEKDTQETYQKIISLISKKSSKGSRLCYWNNLVKRKNHNVKNIKRDSNKSEQLFEKDRVLFYSDFILEEKI